MTRNLLIDPCWKKEDLGTPMPDSPHATSVALPTWDHVVGYEQKRPEIIGAMQVGYPRFVLHPQVAELFASLERSAGKPGERCFAFPSADVARRCAVFLEQRKWHGVRISVCDSTGLHAIFFPERAFGDAKAFWQHFGKIVSSRRAEAALACRPAPAEGERAKIELRERIATLTAQSPERVWLFPTGMAALSRALLAAQERAPAAKSIQLGFPYVDVFKVQTVSGPGTHFVPDYDLDTVASLLASAPISSIVCEFPGNPLLRGCDLVALSKLARRHQVPLIVDDTPATFVNVQTFPYADVLVTSLTKAFSGEGDVMAGSMVINGDSPFAAAFDVSMSSHYEDLFWAEDAIALERNSRDFIERVHQTNVTAEALCTWLATRPEVASVYYPKFSMREAYDRVKREGGGYGSLFSILLHDASRTAPRFYDALRVSKGPSLGNNFTLACPYTLLAHFDELEWAEAHGVSRYLVRVSIGLEPLDELETRFTEALAAAAS